MQTVYTLYSEWDDLGIEGRVFATKEDAVAHARAAFESMADQFEPDDTFETLWADGYIGMAEAEFHGLMPSPVKGYKPLPEATLAAMNNIKTTGAALGALMDEIATNADVAPDVRWFAIARTQLQQGFMALTRSVAKPDFF